MKMFLCVVLGVLITGSVAMAAEGSPSVPSLAIGITNGMLAGAVASLLGWAKNRTAEGGDLEKLEFKHMIPTMLVGIVVGSWAGWQNKDLSTFAAWLDTTPYVITAEILWKVVFRNTAPVVRSALATLKSKPEGTK